MSPAAFERFGRLSTRSISYVLAVILPLLSAIVTSRIASLNALPLALHFIAMAVVATLGGFAPAMLCVVASITSRYYIQPSSFIWPLTAIEVIRPAVLLLSAIVLSALTKQRRQTAEALEVALLTLQEKSDALVESQQASKCASWAYHSRDRTRWVRGGYEVFGRPFEEIERLPSLVGLIFPDDRDAVRDAIAKMISTGAPLHIEYRTLWPNGELHWSEARGKPVHGDPHLWRGVTFDITERKLAEEALVRTEKLAAMGRLATTVAHEVNNPLEAVTNLLFLARGDGSLAEETRAYLEMAAKELARVGNITRLTLGFVRNSERREGVNIVDLLEDVLSIYHHRFEMKNILIERNYQQDVLIDIAPHELRQIALNLISNASDALSGESPRIRVRVEKRESSAVLLVEDNGEGIPANSRERIFEPFFSTKQDVGTGIGLWVTRELVEKNGGSISVVSGDLPEGLKTSFRVEFPATQAPTSDNMSNSLDSAATPVIP